jgi:hypothetical protein
MGADACLAKPFAPKQLIETKFGLRLSETDDSAAVADVIHPPPCYAWRTLPIASAGASYWTTPRP